MPRKGEGEDQILLVMRRNFPCATKERKGTRKGSYQEQEEKENNHWENIKTKRGGGIRIRAANTSGSKQARSLPTKKGGIKKHPLV